jgi:hypothetical protein
VTRALLSAPWWPSLSTGDRTAGRCGCTHRFHTPRTPGRFPIGHPQDAEAATLQDVETAVGVVALCLPCRGAQHMDAPLAERTWAGGTELEHALEALDARLQAPPPIFAREGISTLRALWGTRRRDDRGAAEHAW